MLVVALLFVLQVRLGRQPLIPTRADKMPVIDGHFYSSRLSGKAALIFRKKYSESLNPYAMRFITLILLFHPFQHTRVHQVCTPRIPAYISIKFPTKSLQRR